MCSSALPIPTIDFSIAKITSSPTLPPLVFSLFPLHAIFSFLHFILRLSGECIADASRWKIFIGTRARSYVGNVNHKRQLREILIDSRGQLNSFLPVRYVYKRPDKKSEYRVLEHENLEMRTIVLENRIDKKSAPEFFA